MHNLITNSIFILLTRMIWKIRQYQSVTEAVYYTYMDTKLLEFNNIHQTWILINVISSLLHTSQGQICTDLFCTHCYRHHSSRWWHSLVGSHPTEATVLHNLNPYVEQTSTPQRFLPITSIVHASKVIIKNMELTSHLVNILLAIFNAESKNRTLSVNNSHTCTGINLFLEKFKMYKKGS